MELDESGFHHTVLADFREHLTYDGRADHLLSLALTRLKVAGLVGERSPERTDPTHELITEERHLATERQRHDDRTGKPPARPRTKPVDAAGGTVCCRCGPCWSNSLKKPTSRPTAG